MGKILSVSIFKGGAGKTTTAVSLAAALRLRGNKVLLVDLDQQAQATKHVGIDPEKVNPNLFHVFMRQVPVQLAVHPTDFGFQSLPGNSLLAAIEESMENGDEPLLGQLLSPLKTEFDYIVLDNPATKSMLSRSALTAADLVLIPLQAERPALDGVQDMLKFIQDIIWPKHNPGLKIAGILPTMIKRTTSHSAGVVQRAREVWGDKVYRVSIPESIAFPRAYDHALPITHYDPTHEGAKCYLELAKIIDERA